MPNFDWHAERSDLSGIALLDRAPESEGIDLRAVRLYRLGRVRAEMARRDIGAVILSDPVNIRYATGTRNMQVFSMRNQAARYLLLTAGFFVCGFQVAFITAHFPAYVGDIGIDARYAVMGIALIGFFNIIGSLTSGVLTGRMPKRFLLAIIYLSRSAVIVIFLMTPPTALTVMVFAATMGFLWLSTVPPTQQLVVVMFGTRYMATLFGFVFLSHQIGSFLGVWMGGFMYDQFGSYDSVWWLGVALGLFAAIVHWPIKERPVARPALAAAE